MTTAELRERLNDYGDHVEVRIAAAEDELPPKPIVEIDDLCVYLYGCIALLYDPQ